MMLILAVHVPHSELSSGDGRSTKRGRCV